MTGPRIPAWISDPDVAKSIESGDTETFEAYSARLSENELVDLRRKNFVLTGERNAEASLARRLADKIQAARGYIAGGLTGALDPAKALRLADQALTGTDTTDCTCPPQGGDQ